MGQGEYFYLCEKLDARAATIKRLGDYVENIGALREGGAVGVPQPPAQVPLSEEGGDLLADLIGNNSDALIMSEKALAVLSQQDALSDVEVVPLKLRDKRGAAIEKKYAIVNPRRTVACLDVGRSDAVVNKRGNVLSLYSIQIHADKIPPDARLFRIAEYPACTLIRADLLEALLAGGVQGLRSVAMGENVYE